MTNALSHIDWLAVLAAAVAHFILGAIWFVGLFGKPYAKALGIQDRLAEKPGALFLAGPLVCSAVTIATTSLLIGALGIHHVGDALWLGLVVGVGYLGAMTVNIAINPLFPRPVLYALVNAPMFVIGSMMSCAILVALR